MIAVADRQCSECGVAFSTTGPGRPPKRCPACRESPARGAARMPVLEVPDSIPEIEDPVTTAVKRLVARQRLDGGGLDDLGEARAALAVDLAQKLDSGKAVMASAAISRELRETLAELTGERVDVGNGDPFDQWARGLSTPVQHPKD